MHYQHYALYVAHTLMLTLTLARRLRSHLYSRLRLLPPTDVYVLLWHMYILYYGIAANILCMWYIYGV